MVAEIRTEQLVWRTDIHLQERTRAKEFYVRYARRWVPHHASWDIRVASNLWHGIRNGRQAKAAWQKRSAVKHYLSHGRYNPSPTVRLATLGCSQVLAGWIDELAPVERKTSVARSFSVGKRQPKRPDRACALLYRWRRELACGRSGAREDGYAGEGTTIGELKTRKAELKAELKAEIRSPELRLRYHAGHR